MQHKDSSSFLTTLVRIARERRMTWHQKREKGALAAPTVCMPRNAFSCPKTKTACHATGSSGKDLIEWGRIRRSNRIVVTAIAKRRLGAQLAAAEPDLSAGGGLVLDRNEPGVLVRSVTKGLLLAESTG